MDKHLHAKHRQRMKERLLATGLNGFQDHEVIELLLFFSIPFRNTNDIAHELMNKFGSLSGVLNASYGELIKIKGVGMNTAILITIMPQLFRRYILDRGKGTRVFETIEMIGEYCINHFIGATTEHVELLLFDSQMHMTGHMTVYDGTLSSGGVNPEKLSEYIFGNHASCFVLAHNHPSGDVEPSGDDLYVTREIQRVFEPFNKNILEHFIVAGGRYKRILDAALKMYD